jgi:hypothetical protein
MSAWVGQVMSGLSDPDPSRGPLGEEKVENLSLRPALARYLMHLPYGHLGRPETSDNPDRPNDPPSAGYLQFLDLSPRTAGIVARMIIVALAAGLRLRKCRGGQEAAALRVRRVDRPGGLGPGYLKAHAAGRSGGTGPPSRAVPG